MKVNWSEIERLAHPGDVLLLRREPPEQKEGERHCVLEVIHELGGLYDHAALVTERDSMGNVMIAHATNLKHTVAEIPLVEYPHRGICVRAELRRHKSGSPEIVRRANPVIWQDVDYAYGDLLLAGLAASSTPSGTAPDRVKKVLRARVLALCIVVLSDEILAHKAAVTCASFVKICHDEGNELRGPFTTIARRLEELASGLVGGVDWSEVVDDWVELYRHRLDRTPVYDLMDKTLCPSFVNANDRAPEPDLLTCFSMRFLRRVEQLKVAAPVPVSPTAPTSGPPAVSDADRLLVTIEDLRTDKNLKTVHIEP